MNEVSNIKKELERTVASKDAKKALELLRSLESIPMSLDLLQTTHIGLVVNHTRKSIDNPEVSSLSKSMVKKWKKLISSSSSSGSSTSQNTSQSQVTTHQPTVATTTSSTTNSNSNSNTTNTNTANNNTNNNTNVYHNSSSSNNERVAKRQAPIQTEVPSTTHEVRIKCRAMLADALKIPLPREFMNEAFLEEDILAARIEESIFQEFKSTDMKYRNRFRSRLLNLKDDKNPYLKFNVLRGEISAEKIAKMTAEEMASDDLKRERERYHKEAINDHQMAVTSGTKTSEIKCPACKKYNVTYNQVQTRSADEPMTTFCYCNECGKRWKFC